jgi:hypothetical protein
MSTQYTYCWCGAPVAVIAITYDRDGKNGSALVEDCGFRYWVVLSALTVEKVK